MANMKILLVSPKGDGAWFVWLLKSEGNEVDWCVEQEKDAAMLGGIVPPPKLRVPTPDKYDLIVFDCSGMGDVADKTRAITPVIGASAYADQLEEDRVFGLETMEKAGIRVPKWEPFSTPAEALAFLRHNNKRYVLKPIGELPEGMSDATYVAKSAEDMTNYIEVRLDPAIKSFLLQEFVEGVEVSTEAWWTGSEWVALNHTLEEKKFMDGQLGPNTGCAGNVVWMPPRSNPIFQRGLEKMGPLLKEAGFVGMIDLNTIATEGDLYGLEWTPRFGYEGTCNLTRLLPVPFGDFLYSMALGKTPTLPEAKARFAATVRLSVPPYPSAEFSRKKMQVPIRGLDLDNLQTFVLYDVRLDGKDLVTNGGYNAIGSPIGTGSSIAASFEDVMAAIKRLEIPNLQYRTDIEKCVTKRYTTLQSWGWLRNI